MRVRIKRSKPTRYRKNARALKSMKIGLGIVHHFISHQRNVDIQNAKLTRINKMNEMAEADIAIRNNRILLLDLEIEKKKLELLKLQRELGNPDDFAEKMGI